MGCVCSCFGASDNAASTCWCLNCCSNLLIKYQALFHGGGTQTHPRTNYQSVTSSNSEVIPNRSLEIGSLRCPPKLNVIGIVPNAGVEPLENLTRKKKQVGLDCRGDGSKDYCSPKKSDVEPESSIPLSDDEDVCPTCLEEYTFENPKIITKCSHHYHLSCIFEWQERSEKCPVCGALMEFETH